MRMKLKSELIQSASSKLTFSWAIKMYSDSTVSKNTRKIICSSLLSFGLFGFCLGFYLKMYMVLSLPSFILMVLAALISDY